MILQGRVCELLLNVVVIPYRVPKNMYYLLLKKNWSAYFEFDHYLCEYCVSDQLFMDLGSVLSETKSSSSISVNKIFSLTHRELLNTGN